MFFKDSFPTADESFSKAVSNVIRKGEEIIDYWSILSHPDFPFVTLTSTTNGARNFPVYNIVELANGKVLLEMAIAGYSKDRIKVEKEGNVLIVSGKPAPPPKTAEQLTDVERGRILPLQYRHRGISNAAFTRTFDLNPNAIIENVELADGILTITVSTIISTTSRMTFDIK